MSEMRPPILPPLVCAAVVALAAPAGAQDQSVAREGAVGFAAAVCSLVYSPLKVAHAVGGVVIGSLATLWTLDPGVSAPIFRTSLGGDYVVTPAHLDGSASLRFRGD